MALTCCFGVMPDLFSFSSGASMSMSIRLPTRTMKNSSRLLVKIETKRRRSISGRPGSMAWASTRSLNFSQLSSRFWVKLRSLCLTTGMFSTCKASSADCASRSRNRCMSQGAMPYFVFYIIADFPPPANVSGRLRRDCRFFSEVRHNAALFQKCLVSPRFVCYNLFG